MTWRETMNARRTLKARVARLSRIRRQYEAQEQDAKAHLAMIEATYQQHKRERGYA